MAPVVLALRAAGRWDVRVLATAQHREMLDQTLAMFGIAPHLDLDAMRPDQTLSALTARLMTGLDACLADVRPKLVLAQGDTTTTLVAALASFYRKVPFGHVEAGLRTHDMQYPWPEEMNRVLAGRIATLNFAPTETARRHLLEEGVAAQRIHVTGNTVIDALHLVAKQERPLGVPLPSNKRLVLVTAHRRENFGAPLQAICQGIAALAKQHESLHFLYPVHPNPNVQVVVRRELGGLPSVTLCEPLEYGAFVTAMQRAWLILSDSGGVQEEAPALGKPVLVLRNETERPEAVQAGGVDLIGPDRRRIVTRVTRLLRDEDAYGRMAQSRSPYGDGKAAQRILQQVEQLDSLR